MLDDAKMRIQFDYDHGEVDRGIICESLLRSDLEDVKAPLSAPLPSSLANANFDTRCITHIVYRA